MKEKVLEVLSDIRPDVDFENEKKLIDDRILDSFDIISIIADLNDIFGIEIDIDDLVPENFNTLDAIVDVVNRKSNDIG